MIIPRDAYDGVQNTFETNWGRTNAASVKFMQVTQKEEYDVMMSWLLPSMKGGTVERVVWGWTGVLFPPRVGELGYMTGEEGRDMGEVYTDMLAVLEKELVQ